jgi:hypothetical protein
LRQAELHHRRPLQHLKATTGILTRQATRKSLQTSRELFLGEILFGNLALLCTVPMRLGIQPTSTIISETKWKSGSTMVTLQQQPGKVHNERHIHFIRGSLFFGMRNTCQRQGNRASKWPGLCRVASWATSYGILSVMWCLGRCMDIGTDGCLFLNDMRNVLPI